MGPSQNIEPFMTRRLNGVDNRFGKLTPRDRAAILRRLKAERKETLVGNLQTAGIDKEQMLIELENFDDSPWGQSRWLDHLNTIEGQEEAVRTAWAKQNSGDPAAALDAIEAADGGLLPLAAALCNLRLSPVNAPADSPVEGDDDENPFPPQPADQTATPPAGAVLMPNRQAALTIPPAIPTALSAVAGSSRPFRKSATPTT